MGTGTGPPYPHPNPVPGSNAIGSFIIGISPIGDIPAFDYWQTVISQYANSTILTQLISNFFQYIDPTTNLENFFDLIWNVNTAQGYGLDVWGRIVGVQRTLNLPSAGLYFGFEEQSVTIGTFGQATFFTGQPLTTSFQLSDPSFRILIFAKALANISNCSIPALNQLLLNLFPGRGNCFVTDGGGLPKYNIISMGPNSGDNTISIAVGDGSINSVVGLVNGAFPNPLPAGGFAVSGVGVVVSGVIGTIEANGKWSNTRIDITPALNIGRLTLLGSKFVNPYVSGGAVDTGSGAGSMAMTYTFSFALSTVEAAIITQSGVLPKPTGVSATVVQQVI